MELARKYFMYLDLGSIPVTGAFMYKNRSTYRSLTNAVISLIILVTFLFYSVSLIGNYITNPTFSLTRIDKEKSFDTLSLTP